jgi:hypothetical protein
MPDFNRIYASETPICRELNRLLEEAVARDPEVNNRQYLGASSIGSECLRRVQFDWMVDSIHPLRLRDIFYRGHVFEARTRAHLVAAGFRFELASERLRFAALGGLFRGHCDGILVGGPALPDGGYPCLWEHKALNGKNWRAIARAGVAKAFPHYHAQVLIYQAYLGVTANPAVFTATNADTCERLHLLVPFDATRAQEWSDRAAGIIEATRAGELLPRVTDDPEDWRCKMCGHRARCWRRS